MANKSKITKISRRASNKDRKYMKDAEDSKYNKDIADIKESQYINYNKYIKDM